MVDTAFEPDQLAGLHLPGLPARRQAYFALQAMNHDFALDPVRRHGFARRHDQANDFQLIGLEQRDIARFRQLVAQRLNVNQLSGGSVGNGHSEAP